MHAPQKREQLFACRVFWGWHSYRGVGRGGALIRAIKGAADLAQPASLTQY